MDIRSKLKYIPWIVLILAVGGLAFYQWRAADDARALLYAQNSELMKANLDLGRAQTKIVDQATLHTVAMADIDQKWKAEIKKRNALITLYAQLEARYTAEKKKVKVTTKIIYRDKPGETIDLPKNKLYVRQEDGSYKEITSMAWNYKDFRITISGDAIQQTLSYKLHQRFRVQLVETKLPTGARNHYANLFELDDKGKVVAKLQLAQFNVLRAQELESHMMWWNPKLDLGVGFGMSHKLDFTWCAELGLSVSAYGKTPNDLSWRFFRLGTGITGNGFSLTFSPAQFNLGQHLPLISNMWLTPAIGVSLPDIQGVFTLGISVVF